MNIVEIGSTVLGRCLSTRERLSSGIEHTLPEPVIGGSRAITGGVLGIAGRLMDIPEDLRQRG